MSAVMKDAAQAFVSRFDGLKARLPGDAVAREAAATVFREAGLPGLREEAWKYTSLRPIAEAEFHEPLLSVSARLSLPAWLAELDLPRLVFMDGRFREDMSRVRDGLAFTSFAAHPEFGALAQPARERMVALNTMLAQDGAQIRVPATIDAGALLLVSLADGTAAHPVAFHPRHALVLEEGAALTVIEISIGRGKYLHNPVTTVQVAKGARLTHVRLQDESTEAFHIGTIYTDIAERGVYDSFTLNLGARVARTEVHARLAGENAAAHLNAAQMLRGHQHGDFTTVVRHDAAHCASRQTVKNVLDDHARGVFQGRIEVARGAQKTDGYQMNQALLLSPDAEIDSKPELEIFADDVKCSHGATVGELDENQVFYLRSRGIPEAQARGMLVRSFLAEALEGIGDEGARALLDGALDRWWEAAKP